MVKGSKKTAKMLAVSDLMVTPEYQQAQRCSPKSILAMRLVVVLALNTL